ncbi:MAG TPA: DUF1993 domain-containing protein [Asticcacaulis sp.]|nr:DUF1993 domain-containing protein [Asticcacaulis sp.]
MSQDAATLDRPSADHKLDMYAATVPVCVRALTNLQGILTKAEAWATEKKVDPSVVLNARLALDMFPLVRQVQIVTDTAKGAAARLGGVDVPSYADTEATFAELQARLQKTIDFVKSVKPEGFNESEGRQIVLKFPSSTQEFTGLAYLTGYVIPNMFFHLTTAYAILRHNGMPLGKTDFLGAN